MSETSVRNQGRKKDWALSQGALRGLLNWLDQGADTEGERYLEMRRRLVGYFDRKNCREPDELADETLSRVARRIEEGEVSEREHPARYCYIVARFVFMEHLRSQRRVGAAFEELGRRSNGGPPAPHVAGEEQVWEKMLGCLERCLGELDPTQREVITRYYVGKERVKIENRRALATALGITVNALSIRACRIRDRLEACVRKCAGTG